MRKLDFRGARGANAGDDYHELWLLQQALRLLEHEGPLTALSVQGIIDEDDDGKASDTWSGVDAALYYGGRTAADQHRIDLVQLKYSAADPEKSWTISRLTSSSAARVDNSVIRRLADAFAGVVKKRAGDATGISIRLISNQPVAEDVLNSFHR